jgi:hypothetical protein
MEENMLLWTLHEKVIFLPALKGNNFCKMYNCRIKVGKVKKNLFKGKLRKKLIFLYVFPDV